MGYESKSTVRSAALIGISEKSTGKLITELTTQGTLLPQVENQLENPQINPTDLTHSTPIDALQGFVGGDQASGSSSTSG